MTFERLECICNYMIDNISIGLSTLESIKILKFIGMSDADLKFFGYDSEDIDKANCEECADE